ncbi:hypothetical protein [Caldisericum sp.]|uniref:hypothetical protein n=1 Tax=Caldisericum sp. TaxID=2499687 RepID=UPI003D138E2E
MVVRDVNNRILLEYDPFSEESYEKQIEYTAQVLDEDFVMRDKTNDGRIIEKPMTFYVLSLKKEDGEVTKEQWRIDKNANFSQQSEWLQVIKAFNSIGIRPATDKKNLVGKIIKFKKIKQRRVMPVTDEMGNPVLDSNGRKMWKEVEGKFYYALPLKVWNNWDEAHKTVALQSVDTDLSKNTVNITINATPHETPVLVSPPASTPASTQKKDIISVITALAPITKSELVQKLIQLGYSELEVRDAIFTIVSGATSLVYDPREMKILQGNN